MALVRWEPFEGMTRLREEMDRLFEDFFGSTPLRLRDGGLLEPAIEVAETDEAVVVKAQVPGVSKDNLNLTITDDTLTLKGEVKAEEEQKEKNYYRREIRYGSFQRTIPLPVAVKADQAKAQLKDGILQVTIPKSEEAKSKSIPIEA
ncbi:MAG: Hsp20/alpha crystallin family protein [Nitrospinota bacterium]|nr:MAG: Hsp20/alpha crystallin family protein [Nitrospinota bacterium]